MKDRERERVRDREKERVRDRERERESDRGRERDRESDRERENERERERDGEREREREGEKVRKRGIIFSASIIYNIVRLLVILFSTNFIYYTLYVFARPIISATLSIFGIRITN